MSGSLFRKLLQILISLALLSVLAVIAIRQHVASQIRAVPPGYVLGAIALVCMAWLVNAGRWALLLRVAGPPVAWATLARVYFIGMFFSMMLPTGAGGDAFRMWDVTRRTGNGPAVVVSTLQERLLGMGVAMLIGFIAVLTHLPELPRAGRPFFIAFPLFASVACAAALYPRFAFGPPRKMLTYLPRGRWVGSPWAAKVTAVVVRMEALPILTPSRLIPILLVTVTGVLLSFSVGQVLAWGVSAQISFGELCVAIPLVWVIAMTPSVGGLGVREGALVAMLMLFSVPKEKAIAIAALNLAVNFAAAGLGGVALAYQTFFLGAPRSKPVPVEVD